MRVMVGGGGTGGHTSPATAVIEELRRLDPEVRFEWVGRGGRIEERVAGALGIPFRAVPVEGWPRGRSLRKVWVAVKLALSIGVSAVHILRFRPDAVFGVGGYVSLPLLYAAQRLGTPTVIHEQNQLLGMANGLLAPRARHIFLSYPNTSGRFPEERAEVVGNPVRGEFANPPEKPKARVAFGLEPALPVVLACGGSQGARTINEAMKDVVRAFGEREAQFIWMTGKGQAAEARRAAEEAPAKVLVLEYIEDMVTACAAADVLVSRSGASTTAELALLGKPSILVPYPHAAEGHQEENARAFEEAGAAVLLLDADCRGPALTRLLKDLLADRERLASMGRAAKRLAKPDAARHIAEAIAAFGKEGG